MPCDQILLMTSQSVALASHIRGETLYWPASCAFCIFDYYLSLRLLSSAPKTLKKIKVFVMISQAR